MKNIFLLILFSCGSDIAIITRDQKTQDTSDVVAENSAETNEEAGEASSEPSEETSSEMTDLTIGYAEMYLTQIACPACMGVQNEFDIGATLKLHQPTNGDYNEWLTPVGTCVTQELGSYVSSTPLSLTGNVSFNTIQLFPVGQAEWMTNSIQEYQFPRSTDITVTTAAGSIPNAFKTLEGNCDLSCFL